MLTVDDLAPKTDLWSHKQASNLISMPEISSESELVTFWLLPCLQGINDVTANLIGFIKELHCLRLLL